MPLRTIDAKAALVVEHVQVSLNESGGVMNSDEKIAEIDAEIQLLREQADEALQQFLQTAVSFFCDWSRRAVERGVTSQPETTKKLGLEGLRLLKGELKDLCDKMPEHVQKHMNHKALWLHRGDIPQHKDYTSSPYRFSGNRAPDKIDAPVREILGYVGALLLKFGLAKRDKDSEWEQTTAQPVPRYRYGFDWSAEMKTALKQYSDIYDNLARLVKETASIERQKAEAEAKSLWDQA